MSRIEYVRLRMRHSYPSGGSAVKVPKTQAERLALYLKLAKLKADYVRRNGVG